MKKSGILFGMVLASAFFIMCGQQKSKETIQDSAVESDLDLYGLASPTSYDEVVGKVEEFMDSRTASDKIEKSLHVYSDGTSAGLNIAAVLDPGDFLHLKLVAISPKGEAKTVGSFDLPADMSLGAVIQLKHLKIDDKTSFNLFEIETDIRYDPATIGGYKTDRRNMGRFFDLKIVSGGANTKGLPAIVGADDAREYIDPTNPWDRFGNTLEAISEWKNGEKVYVFYHNEGGTDYIKFFTEGNQPEDKDAMCFFQYGQIFWGTDFRTFHIGC